MSELTSDAPLDTVDDIEEALGTETPKVEETSIPPDDDTDNDDDTETESETEETEETEEEQEESEEESESLSNAKDDTEYLSPVRRAEILKAFPDLFKKFPYLERAYYGNQQFREIFPTINDAKEANEAARTLKNFESDIMTGSTKNLLKSIKDGSPEVFTKIADNYLRDLYETDGGTYHTVVGNLITTLARDMVAEAERSGNESLKSAAVIVNQFMFGDSRLRPVQRLSKEAPRDARLEHEKQEFARQRYETAFNDIAGRVNNKLKSSIDENIDKNSSMSDYVKKNVSKECLESVHNLIGQDKTFRAHLDKLWENARSNNYSPDSLAAIRKSYISKAQTVLPSVIKKARNEALGNSKVKAKEGEVKTNRTPIKPGRTAGSTKSGTKSIPKGMSDMDFLMSD